MQVVGLIFLVIFAIFIIFARKTIKQKGGPALNGAMQVGDAFIWIRFIGGIAIALFLLFIILVFRKK